MRRIGLGTLKQSILNPEFQHQEKFCSMEILSKSKNTLPDPRQGEIREIKRELFSG